MFLACENIISKFWLNSFVKREKEEGIKNQTQVSIKEFLYLSLLLLSLSFNIIAISKI